MGKELSNTWLPHSSLAQGHPLLLGWQSRLDSATDPTGTMRSGITAVSSHSVSTTGLNLPSIEQILVGFPEKSTSLPPRNEEIVSQKDQEELFCTLKNAIENAELTADAGNSFDLKRLHASLEQAGADARRGWQDSQSLQSVHAILVQLWSCNSEFLIQAAELLANRSRDREFICERPS